MLTHMQKRCWDETGIMQRNVTCMRGTGNVKSRLRRWSRFAAPSPLSVKLLDRNPDSCWLQNAHKTLHVAPQAGEGGGGGCCTEVRWKAYFVYISAKHSDAMCSLMPESKYMTIHSDMAGKAPLYCQSRPVCSCVTTSFKSEPSLSLQLRDRCQRLTAPLPAPPLTGAELQTVLQTPAHLKMKLSSTLYALAATVKALSYWQQCR